MKPTFKLKKIIILIIFFCQSTTAQDFHQALALRWAPVHVQYVCDHGKDGLKGRADYVTAVDYDGDWNSDNNWENLSDSSYSLSAKVYYSVVQTATHWYINYAFFHPRDWSNKFIIKYFDTHENDLEGALFIIKRPAVSSDTAFGEFLGMVTVFHSGFYAFSNILKANHQTVKPLEMWRINNQLHPVTCQQSRGHGLKAYPNIQEKKHSQIHYYPSLQTTAKPLHNNDKKAQYQLINIFEPNGLLAHRNSTETFITPTGGFNGTYGGKYNAKPPWVWNSALDNKVLKGGEHALDPVKVAKYYFEMGVDCGEVYEGNGYEFHK